MSKSIGIYCPHCQTRMWLNGKKKLSAVLQKLVMVCRNERCLASFNAHIEIVSGIHDSLTPKHEIKNNIRQLHPWFTELEFLISSVEVNPQAAPETIHFIKGFISSLMLSSLIDLAEAQHYTRRLEQFDLFRNGQST